MFVRVYAAVKKARALYDKLAKVSTSSIGAQASFSFWMQFFLRMQVNVG